jgi:hypothetical protein
MKRFSYLLRSYWFCLSPVVINSICVGSSINLTGWSTGNWVLLQFSYFRWHNNYRLMLLPVTNWNLWPWDVTFDVYWALFNHQRAGNWVEDHLWGTGIWLSVLYLWHPTEEMVNRFCAGQCHWSAKPEMISSYVKFEVFWFKVRNLNAERYCKCR